MNEFGNYLQRNCYKRKNLFNGITKATYYRRLKHPEELTISELRWLVLVGELDEQKVFEFVMKGE